MKLPRTKKEIAREIKKNTKLKYNELLVKINITYMQHATNKINSNKTCPTS